MHNWRCKRLTCNAILGQAVHFASADVQLQREEWLALRGCAEGQYCGVQALQAHGQHGVAVCHEQ